MMDGPAIAVFMPPRENALQAMQEALEMAHRKESFLATDGVRLAWLPKLPAGWERIGGGVK